MLLYRYIEDLVTCNNHHKLEVVFSINHVLRHLQQIK